MTDPVLPGWGVRFGQEARYGVGGTLRVDSVVQGVRVTTASATVTIKPPGSDTAIITAASATISGGEISYALTATDTATYTLREGYSAEWTITVGSTAQPLRRTLFDVVRMPLLDYPPFSVDEMRAQAPRYDALVVNGALQTKADIHIRNAWEEIIKWLKANTRRPSLVNDPADFAWMLRCSAMAKLAFAAKLKEGDVWAKDHDVFLEEFDEARSNFKPVYSDGDAAGTGTPVAAIGQPAISWGPRHQDRAGRLLWRPS